MRDRKWSIGGFTIIPIFFLITLGFCQSNDQITITTYYPSPSGVYNELRFSPHNNGTPCDAAHKGYVLYDSTAGVDNLVVCRYNSISSAYEWVPGGGGRYWEAKGNDIYNTNSGKVGIGTTTPAAKLTIQDGAILASGTILGPNGGTPASGDGTRLMWIPAKSAFRAGTTVGGNWDDANIGRFSIAMGNNPIAGGQNSVAIGGLVNAGGDDSVAIGSVSSASGRYSVVLGVANDATGLESIVLGNNSRAIANGAHAIGNSVIASGLGSFAIGVNAYATGVGSTAIGGAVTASGDYSIALGQGIDPGLHFDNNVPGSLMVGFGSTLPSLFVGPPNSMGTSSVGIGTSSPSAKLHVERGGVNVDTDVGLGAPGQKATVQVSGVVNFDIGGTSSATTAIYAENKSGSASSCAVYGRTTNGVGQHTTIRGTDYSSTNNTAAVLGESLSLTGQTRGVYGLTVSATDGAAGVYGWSEDVNGQNYGVFGYARSAIGYGGYFTGGLGLYGSRIEAGGSQTGAQKLVYDVAEDIDAPGCESGDVVAVAPDVNRRVIKSTKAYDTTVAGVISETPVFRIGKTEGFKPLALAGQVYCKVIVEGGPIKRGDLLVTSSKPGYAMKAEPERLKPGMILGKALEPLDKGEGKILVLITHQ